MIKAVKLKPSQVPEKTQLYEIGYPRHIIVEEKQSDSTLDQVVMEYCTEAGAVRYFGKEYRPSDVEKTGSKVIDITAVMLNHGSKYIRWHLYDIKDTLAGENTIVKLYNQWNSSLHYLDQNILTHAPEYSTTPDLGVITRNYDEERMIRLRDDFQKKCDELTKDRHCKTLTQQKKRLNIAKYRGVLIVAQAILDKQFRTEQGTDTYEIHIRQLLCENGQVYKMRFPV